MKIIDLIGRRFILSDKALKENRLYVSDVYKFQRVLHKKTIIIAWDNGKDETNYTLNQVKSYFQDGTWIFYTSILKSSYGKLINLFK